MWSVYRNNIFTGIKVSNYSYEKPYWDMRSRVTGDRFKLVWEEI